MSFASFMSLVRAGSVVMGFLVMAHLCECLGMSAIVVVVVFLLLLLSPVLCGKGNEGDQVISRCLCYMNKRFFDDF